MIRLLSQVGVFIATRETPTLPFIFTNQTRQLTSGRWTMARGTATQRSKVRKDSWTVQVYLDVDPETGRKR